MSRQRARHRPTHTHHRWRGYLRRFRILIIVYVTAIPLAAFEVYRSTHTEEDTAQAELTRRYTNTYCQLYPQWHHCDFLRGVEHFNETRDLDQARTYFERAMQSGIRTNRKLLRYYAETLVRLQAAPEEIATAVDHWIQNCPSEKSAADQLMARATSEQKSAKFFQQARQREAEGHWKEAMNLYRQVIDRDAKFIVAYFSLADLLFNKAQQPAAAVPYYQKGLQLDPRNVKAHLELANAFEIQGKLSEAIKHLRESIRHRPDYAFAYYNLANILHKQNKLDEAIENYQRALDYQPDDAKIHHNLGMTLRKLGRVGASERHLGRAAELGVEQQ